MEVLKSKTLAEQATIEADALQRSIQKKREDLLQDEQRLALIQQAKDDYDRRIQQRALPAPPQQNFPVASPFPAPATPRVEEVQHQSRSYSQPHTTYVSHPPRPTPTSKQPYYSYQQTEPESVKAHYYYAQNPQASRGAPVQHTQAMQGEEEHRARISPYNEQPPHISVPSQPTRTSQNQVPDTNQRSTGLPSGPHLRTSAASISHQSASSSRASSQQQAPIIQTPPPHSPSEITFSQATQQAMWAWGQMAKNGDYLTRFPENVCIRQNLWGCQILKYLDQLYIGSVAQERYSNVTYRHLYFVDFNDFFEFGRNQRQIHLLWIALIPATGPAILIQPAQKDYWQDRGYRPLNHLLRPDTPVYVEEMSPLSKATQVSEALRKMTHHPNPTIPFVSHAASAQPVKNGTVGTTALSSTPSMPQVVNTSAAASISPVSQPSMRSDVPHATQSLAQPQTNGAIGNTASSSIPSMPQVVNHSVSAPISQVYQSSLRSALTPSGPTHATKHHGQPMTTGNTASSTIPSMPQVVNHSVAASISQVSQPPLRSALTPSEPAPAPSKPAPPESVPTTPPRMFNISSSARPPRTPKDANRHTLAQDILASLKRKYTSPSEAGEPERKKRAIERSFTGLVPLSSISSGTSTPLFPLAQAIEKVGPAPAPISKPQKQDRVQTSVPAILIPSAPPHPESTSTMSVMKSPARPNQPLQVPSPVAPQGSRISPLLTTEPRPNIQSAGPPTVQQTIPSPAVWIPSAPTHRGSASPLVVMKSPARSQPLQMAMSDQSPVVPQDSRINPLASAKPRSNIQSVGFSSPTVQQTIPCPTVPIPSAPTHHGSTSTLPVTKPPTHSHPPVTVAVTGQSPAIPQSSGINPPVTTEPPPKIQSAGFASSPTVQQTIPSPTVPIPSAPTHRGSTSTLPVTKPPTHSHPPLNVAVTGQSPAIPQSSGINPPVTTEPPPKIQSAGFASSPTVQKTIPKPTVPIPSAPPHPESTSTPTRSNQPLQVASPVVAQGSRINTPVTTEPRSKIHSAGFASSHMVQQTIPNSPATQSLSPLVHSPVANHPLVKDRPLPHLAADSSRDVSQASSSQDRHPKDGPLIHLGAENPKKSVLEISRPSIVHPGQRYEMTKAAILAKNKASLKGGSLIDLGTGKPKNSLLEMPQSSIVGPSITSQPSIKGKEKALVDHSLGNENTNISTLSQAPAPQPSHTVSHGGGSDEESAPPDSPSLPSEEPLFLPSSSPASGSGDSSSDSEIEIEEITRLPVKKSRRKRTVIVEIPEVGWAKRDMMLHRTTQSVSSSSSSESVDARQQRIIELSWSAFRERPCEWDGCEAILNSAWSLQRHLTVVHGEEPFVCQMPDCNVQFQNLEEFHNHMTFHASIPLYCTFRDCERFFDDIHTLFPHHAKHKKNEEEMKCHGLDNHQIGALDVECLPTDNPPPLFQVAPPPMSRERHLELGPWVLRRMCGPMKMHPQELRYSPGNRLRREVLLANHEFDYARLEEILNVKKAVPRKFQRLRDVPSHEVTKMCRKGLFLFYQPKEGEEARDEDDDEEEDDGDGDEIEQTDLKAEEEDIIMQDKGKGKAVDDTEVFDRRNIMIVRDLEQGPSSSTRTPMEEEESDDELLLRSRGRGGESSSDEQDVELMLQ